jgi:hypothetical protein
MIYETYESETGNTFIKRVNDDGTETHFATDPANSDYQAYLRWLNGEEENGTIS